MQVLKAIRRGRIDEAAAFLERHPALARVRNGWGDTALHLAAAHSHLPLIDPLLRLGTPIDAVNRLGNTALHEAAESGQHAMVSCLLARGADPSTRNAAGFTPLYYANPYERDHPVATADALLASGATWDLHSAAVLGHREAAAHLLDSGSMPSARSANGLTPLHCLAIGARAVPEKRRADVIDILGRLLHAGADPLARDGRGLTPAHHASSWLLPHLPATCREPDAILALNAADHDAAAALAARSPATARTHLRHALGFAADRAADDDYRRCIQALGDLAGEDVHAAAFLGDEPTLRALHARVDDWRSWECAHAGGWRMPPATFFAWHGGHRRLLEWMLATGADPDARSWRGESPGGTLLHLAAQRGRLEEVQMLIASGADGDAQNWHGETPLHCALHPDQSVDKPMSTAVVRFLLDARCDATIRAKWGSTPLHFTVEFSDPDVMCAVIAAGADREAADKFGRTPLGRAVAMRNRPMAEALIAAGARLETQDIHGSTPLHLAVFRGDAPLAERLIAVAPRLKAIPDAQGRTPLDHARARGSADLATLLA